MGEFEVLPLGELGADRPSAFATGPFGSAVSAKNFVSKGVPMLRGSNLSEDIGIRLNESEIVFISEQLARKYSRSIVEPGDLVFTCWGTIGQLGLIESGNRFDRYLVSNKQMKVTVDSQRVIPLFLYYFLSQRSMIDLVRGQAIGSSVPGFNLGQLKALPIKLPSLPGQRAIVEVLSALDDKIAANERVIDAAQALMLSYVRSADDWEPLSRLAQQSRASVKPEGFADVVAHFSLPAFDDGATPEIVSGRTIKSNKFVLAERCVLFSKLNPRIPRIWNVSKLPAEMALASTEFVVLTPLRVDPSVLWAALSQPEISEELRQLVAGTSGSHQRIRAHDLLGVRVRDVRALDSKSTDAVSQLGQICQERRQESRALARTRDELLPLLMSGKVRVKDAEAEASEVL